MKAQTPYCTLLTLAALACLFTSQLCAQTAVSGQTLVGSVFQGGTDAWKGETDAAFTAEIAKLRGQVAPPRQKSIVRPVKPTRDATVPTGGFITLAALGGDGRTLYFSAPNKYRGNRTEAYGGSLVVKLRQAATGQFSNPPFVVLASKKTILHYYLGRNPGNVWERIEVPLKEGSGWVNPGKGARVPATKADFDEVLGALTDLLIQAEYSFREDRADLAEVQLNKPAR